MSNTKNTMPTKNEFPPNYAKIQEFFPNTKEHQALFCYGGTIYNPFGVKITPDLEAHETVHAKQQGDNPEMWWNQYCVDKSFRLDQEVEAYGAQYALALKVAPRKLSDWVKRKCAEALSGSLYGNLLTLQEAESRIRKQAKTIINII